jgi:1-acyl-sn-glycerol-3-phosphate acyltransferase
VLTLVNGGSPDAAERNWFQKLCLGVLSLFGWRTVYKPPAEPKGIILVYPHTSNWDFIIGILFSYGYGLGASWIAKHSAFRWPLGPLLRRIGGIPIDRRKASGTIGAMVDAYRESESLWIAITPEGTRSRTDHWKSGFYRIALAADVPCALGFIDFKTKTVSIATYIRFTGETGKDLARLREFYAGKRGLRPEKEGDICFRT